MHIRLASNCMRRIKPLVLITSLLPVKWRVERLARIELESRRACIKIPACIKTYSHRRERTFTFFGPFISHVHRRVPVGKSLGNSLSSYTR